MCCVYECQTNYESERKKRGDGVEAHVYRFSNQSFFPRERERWIEIVSKINANFKVTKETVLCQRHWPVMVNGLSIRHRYSTTFHRAFIVPPTPPPARATVRTSCHERNRQDDEINEFQQRDQLTFHSLKEELRDNKRQFGIPFRCVMYDDSVVMLSDNYFEGIPYFMVKIFPDLKFETYHLGAKVFISSLNTIRASKINT